jgi:hypothetical protein
MSDFRLNEQAAFLTQRNVELSAEVARLTVELANRQAALDSSAADLAARTEELDALAEIGSEYYALHQGCSDPKRSDCPCQLCVAVRVGKFRERLTAHDDAVKACAKAEGLREAATEIEPDPEHTEWIKRKTVVAWVRRMAARAEGGNDETRKG